MSKLLIILLVSLFGLPMTIGAQTEDMTKTAAARFFSSAPIDVATGLSAVSRLDMIDYFTHGSTVRSENRLGRKAALNSISENMIVWQDDDRVRTSIVVLPETASFSPDTLLMVIRTIVAPVADSEISFYDSSWRRLSDKSFPRPVLKDWIEPEWKKSVNEIGDALPFMFVKAEFDPQTDTLVFTNLTDQYFAAEDIPDQLPMLKAKLKYVWNGKSFSMLDE